MCIYTLSDDQATRPLRSTSWIRRPPTTTTTTTTQNNNDNDIDIHNTSNDDNDSTNKRAYRPSMHVGGYVTHLARRIDGSADRWIGSMTRHDVI